MRFCLLDRILSCEPGKALLGLKRLTAGEEYLADHFPGFPLMPGVLQLQSLVEAGSWLIRLSDDFRHSVIVLRELKSAKFGSLMQPGKTLMVTVELTARDGDVSQLKGKGECEGIQTVSAQFSLVSYNLADRRPTLRDRDDSMVKHWRSIRTVLEGELQGVPCC
jgi:3-hydroxyacyl-[acyl-carrier-protein] dehydratase